MSRGEGDAHPADATRSALPDDARAVLDFWFLELGPPDWFTSSASLDRTIADRFGAVHRDAAAGRLDHWAETANGLLALVIVLDQFSRNIHRDSPYAYAQDEAAQALTCRALEKDWDTGLGMSQRQFLYMPLMHAEDAGLQRLGVEKYTRLAEDAKDILGFAESHLSIVEQFGRFPYRNKVLGRPTTEDEREWIDENGNPFA